MIKLSECQEENDLGVIFDNKLSFDQHIQKKINKANQVLGIIKRTFSFLDKDTFLRLYKSLVRPHLEYANVIWNPHLIRQSAAIERVQRRATKLLPGCKNLSYEQRLRAIKLPSLKSRRLRGDMIQTYKIFNNIDDLNTDYFFSTDGYNRTRNPTNKMFIIIIIIKGTFI